MAKRSPSDIAADILNYPVDKEPQETFERTQDYSDRSFKYELEDAIRFAPLFKELGKAPETAQQRVLARAGDYQTLLQTLEKIRVGSAKPKLQHSQLETLRNAPELIELLARSSTEEAMTNADERSGILPEIQRTIGEDSVRMFSKLTGTPANKLDKELRDKNREEAARYEKEYSNEADNYRTHITALFEELAQALGIALNPVRQK